MKIIAMLAMAAMLGTGAQAEQSVETVTVYVVNDATVPPTILCQARNLASQMFARAGIEIQWRTGRPVDSASSEDPTVVVGLEDRTPINRKPGALGFARPVEGVHVTVFYDRVERLTSDRGLPTLLAFVLVHEITHALQGESRHAETGVMKAHWLSRDYYEIARNPFTEDDVDRIHRGLLARRAHSS